MAEYPTSETVESKSSQRTPPPEECVEAVMVDTPHRDVTLRASGVSADVADDHEALGTRLRCGDAEIVIQLLTQLGPEMQRRLFRKYRGGLRAGEAEDVLMIALQRLWMRRAQFDAAKGSLPGWLWRIADHAAHDMIRTGWCCARAHESNVTSDRMDELCDRAGAHCIADVPAVGPSSGKRTALQEALARLPDGQRRVVLADARSPGGTADTGALARELGITPSAVRSRRQRALKQLRHELSPPPPTHTPGKSSPS